MASKQAPEQNPTKRWQRDNNTEYNINNRQTTISIKLIQKSLRSHANIVVSIGASVYVAGVLEYLIAEILDTAITQTGMGRVEPDHILSVIHRDEELTQVFPPLGQPHYQSSEQIEEKDQLSCNFNKDSLYQGYLRSVTTGALGVCSQAVNAVSSVYVHLKRVGSLVQSHLVQ